MECLHLQKNLVLKKKLSEDGAEKGKFKLNKMENGNLGEFPSPKFRRCERAKAKEKRLHDSKRFICLVVNDPLYS